MKTSEKKSEPGPLIVPLKPIKMKRIALTLVGETDYVPGKPPPWLADQMRAMMDRRKGEPYPPPPPRQTPEEEARSTIHLTKDQKHPFGIPSSSFHGSMMQAAREIMHLPVDQQRLFRVLGGVLPIECKNVDLCVKDVVFRGKKAAKEELRTHYPVTIYRAHFHAPWIVHLECLFLEEIMPLDTLGQLVQYAGQFIGLGQGRPGLGGHETNGVYAIEGTKVTIIEKVAA